MSGKIVFVFARGWFCDRQVLQPDSGGSWRVRSEDLTTLNGQSN
jgi:hypothetical protein